MGVASVGVASVGVASVGVASVPVASVPVASAAAASVPEKTETARVSAPDAASDSRGYARETVRSDPIASAAASSRERQTYSFCFMQIILCPAGRRTAVSPAGPSGTLIDNIIPTPPPMFNLFFFPRGIF